MKHSIILYIATLLVMVPLDFLFLGIIAKGFLQSQIGSIMGELQVPAAVAFYLLYAAGIVIFVNSGTDVTWQNTLLFGALFGMFCYATFDLTAMALIKGYTWPVVFVDISWGAFVTAVSATAGLYISRLFS